jgi:hypothetical protein
LRVASIGMSSKDSKPVLQRRSTFTHQNSGTRRNRGTHRKRAAMEIAAVAGILAQRRRMAIARMLAAGSHAPTPGSCFRRRPKCSANRGHAQRPPVRAVPTAVEAFRRLRYWGAGGAARAKAIQRRSRSAMRNADRPFADSSDISRRVSYACITAARSRCPSPAWPPASIPP